MNKKDVLQQLTESNNGYLLSAIADENNISKEALINEVVNVPNHSVGIFYSYIGTNTL